MLEWIADNQALTGVVAVVAVTVLPLFLSEKKTKGFGATVAWLQFKFLFQRADSFNGALKIITFVFTTGYYFAEGYYLKLKELQGVKDKQKYLKDNSKKKK